MFTRRKKKNRKTLAYSKKSRTFAALLKESTSERKFWRDGRVVDRGGLENRCTERYRGFESLSLRKKKEQMRNHLLFLFIPIYLFLPWTFSPVSCFIVKNKRKQIWMTMSGKRSGSWSLPFLLWYTLWLYVWTAENLCENSLNLIRRYCMSWSFYLYL